MKRAAIMAAALAVLWTTGPAGAADVYPECAEMERVKSGTFQATLKSVGVVIGARWGEGTVTMDNGSSFNFTMSGGTLLDIGATATEFDGTVYNLNDVNDFPGIFSGVSTGAALIKGLGGVSLTNANCVVLNASADKTGLQLSAGADGVKVELAE